MSRLSSSGSSCSDASEPVKLMEPVVGSTKKKAAASTVCVGLRKRIIKFCLYVLLLLSGLSQVYSYFGSQNPSSHLSTKFK